MDRHDRVQFLKGVGPRRAELLEKSGIAVIEDLLYHLPFRYEDRRSVVTVGEARTGEDVNLVGTIGGVTEHRRRGRRGSILRAVFEDGGGIVQLVWFHQAAYFRDRLAGGGQWLVHGRFETAPRGGRQIVHPEIEALPEGKTIADIARILPVYQKPTDIPVAAMRTMVERAVEGCADAAVSVVPEEVRLRVGLAPTAEALRYVHRPPTTSDVAALAESRTEAHRTLIFEELFTLQVGMSLRRAAREREQGIAMARADDSVEEFFAALPFEPTGAQRRVVDEIAEDMARPRPMNRLVHGDVGSGKTVVAFAAAVQAIAAGRQVAVMAPTELLADQHFATMQVWSKEAGFSIHRLTGSMRSKEAAAIRRATAAGRVDIVVGTHALVAVTSVRAADTDDAQYSLAGVEPSDARKPRLEFANLGLAIVDEQHRFGVEQRKALKMREGGQVDSLLLSATPIPRTLSLTLYGDIDVSFLDELPAGRRPITTKVFRTRSNAKLHERMAAAMQEGRQCYVVYPLVEESEKMDLADATTMADQLAAGPFAEFTVGLIHGRMKASEKDSIMRRFKAGEIHCLVATTVIEVGIDVPNATIMVVEHAERFGLAQLHQLRGRVGRGSEDSFCCLVADEGQGRDAFERLGVMERTSDGFEIAEADLKLRGPGEYLGTKQSGAPAFRAANLVRDGELLSVAREEALAWLGRDPRLVQPESRELRTAIEGRWSAHLDLAEVG